MTYKPLADGLRLPLASTLGVVIPEIFVMVNVADSISTVRTFAEGRLYPPGGRHVGAPEVPAELAAAARSEPGTRCPLISEVVWIWVWPRYVLVWCRSIPAA